MYQIKLQSEYEDLDKYKSEIGNIIYCKKDTDILHNSYGPAIIWKDGSKFYFINNKRHRLDGPSSIYSNGEEYYYINGDYLTEEQFEIHPERLKFLGKEHLICLS